MTESLGNSELLTARSAEQAAPRPTEGRRQRTQETRGTWGKLSPARAHSKEGAVARASPQGYPGPEKTHPCLQAMGDTSKSARKPGSGSQKWGGEEARDLVMPPPRPRAAETEGARCPLLAVHQLQEKPVLPAPLHLSIKSVPNGFGLGGLQTRPEGITWPQLTSKEALGP